MAKSRKPVLPKPRRYAGGGTSMSYMSPDHIVRQWAVDGNEGAHPDIKFDNLIVVTLEEYDKTRARSNVVIQVKEYVPMTTGIIEVTANTITESPPAPIYRPSLILDLLVPYDRAQDMQANLGDLYPVWVGRYGVRRANFIRGCQVAWLIGGTWWEKLLSSGERLLKVFRVIGS